MHYLRKSDGVIRGKFTRFDDNGVAGNQRWRQFAGNQEEREVPWQDPGGNTQRTFKDKDIFAGTVALENFTFIATRPLRHIIDIVGGEIDFHLRQLLDFPAFGNNQRTDFARSGTNTGGNFA